MEREMEKYVLSLLEGYSQTTKILCLMRYELQHINAVSPEEMIEVMALSRKGDSVDSEFPHDVAGIALCFREVAERLNNDAADELATEYIALLSQRDRLLHYISLLEPRQHTIIKEHYMEQHSWTEVANQMGITRRTAYKIRHDAIRTLVRFYMFAEKVNRQKER